MDIKHTELRIFHSWINMHIPPGPTRYFFRNVNQYLGELEEELDVKQQQGRLRLDQRGMCAFQYQNLVIVIEVPRQGKSMFVYSVVYRVSHDEMELGHAVMRKALELNYLQQDTCGTVLSLDRMVDECLEFTLSFVFPMSGMTCNEFCTIVMNFITASVGANSTLRRTATEFREEQRQKAAAKDKEQMNDEILAVPVRREGVRSEQW